MTAVLGLRVRLRVRVRVRVRVKLTAVLGLPTHDLPTCDLPGEGGCAPRLCGAHLAQGRYREM
jgi:hypothetical protein